MTALLERVLRLSEHCFPLFVWKNYIQNWMCFNWSKHIKGPVSSIQLLKTSLEYLAKACETPAPLLRFIVWWRLWSWPCAKLCVIKTTNKRIICIVVVNSYLILSFAIESDNWGQNLEQIFGLSYFVIIFY